MESLEYILKLSSKKKWINPSAIKELFYAGKLDEAICLFAGVSALLYF